MDFDSIRSSLYGARVAVTGGSGFLGRKIVEALSPFRPAEVFAPRRLDYDLVQRDDVRRFFADLRPDIVIHAAAAVGGIGANAAYPGKFFYENLQMGLNVIEEARQANVRKVSVIGTVCAYPKFAPIPFKEDDLWNGYPEETNAPYGIAKKALLVQLQAYRAQYGTSGVFVLPVNLYGPGDNFDPASSHVIPALIRKCTEAQQRGEDQIIVWGDGSATREFLYVDDAARGIVQATAYYDDPEPVNLGAEFEISIRDLVTLVAKHSGFTGTIVWDTSKPNGQPRRKLDVSRARERFGFVATTDFETGLDATIAWYRRSQMVAQ